MLPPLPLLHRICDTLERPVRERATRLSEADLRACVICDVTLLLNSRACIAASHGGGRRTIIEYGLPDFTHLSPHNVADADQLANWIKDTIDAFEPRLAVESVSIDFPRRYRDEVQAQISGQLRMGDTRADMAFSVAISGL